LFITEDDDSGAVWTADVESCVNEISGTLVRVPTELTLADAVFWSTVAVKVTWPVELEVGPV
jgi:hypothetical protein